jgi:hypothetical protein
MTKEIPMSNDESQTGAKAGLDIGHLIFVIHWSLVIGGSLVI